MKITEESLRNMIETAVSKSVTEQSKEAVKEEVEKAEVEVKAEEKVEKKAEKASIPNMLKPEKTDIDIAQEEADKKEFKSFGEFILALEKFRRYGHSDNRLVFINSKGKMIEPVHYTVESQDQLVKTMTEGTDSAGGFLIPEQYVMEIQQLALERSIVRSQNPMLIPMSTDTVNIPRIDESSHASTLYGGIAAYWTEEAGTKTESEPKFGNCKLTAHELSGYTRASNALIADNAVGLEMLLKRLFSDAYAWFEDTAFVTGNGVGQPLGITNSPCLISITRQANTIVRYNDLVAIWSQVFPESRGKGVWLMNHEVLEQLMQAGAGNAAQASGHQLVWVAQDQGAALKLPEAIFGRPYIVTEKMPALGSASDIGFFDLSYYIIGDRQKLTIDSSSHVGFTSNTTYWRFVIRVDGQPWLSSAITPANGTQTLSPFVALSSTS